MKSTGKRFEENFRKSIPKGVFYYRFRDNNNTWSRGDNVRFATSNIADCLLFDGDYLYLLELKSCKGKSLPFNNVIGNKTKLKQIDDLLTANQHKNTICGLVIEFSDLDECYFIEISRFKAFLDKSKRKSLPIDYLRRNGIKIGVEKKKTNRRFDIVQFVKDMGEIEYEQ